MALDPRAISARIVVGADGSQAISTGREVSDAWTQAAGAIRTSAQGTQTALDALTARLSAAGAGIDRVGASASQSASGFSALDAAAQGAVGSLSRLDGAFGSVEGSLSGLEGSVRGLSASFGAVDSVVSSMVTSLGRTDAAFAGVESSVAKLDSTFGSIAGSVSDADAAFSSVAGSAGKLDGSLATLRGTAGKTGAMLANAGDSAYLLDASMQALGESTTEAKMGLNEVGSEAVDLANEMARATGGFADIGRAVQDVVLHIEGLGSSLEDLGFKVDAIVSGSFADFDASLAAASESADVLTPSLDASAVALDDTAAAADRAAEANHRLADSQERVHDSAATSPVAAGGSSRGGGSSQTALRTTSRSATEAGLALLALPLGSLFEAGKFQAAGQAVAGNANLSPAITQAMDAAVLKLFQAGPVGYSQIFSGYQRAAETFPQPKGMSDKSYEAELASIDAAAWKSAIGSSGNLATIAGALALSMHNWGVAPQNASTAMDVLHSIAAYAGGGTTVEKLSANMGKSSAEAAMAGISMPQWGGMFDVLSKQFGTARTDTYLAALIQKMMSQSKGAQADLSQLGLGNEFNLAGLENLGPFKLLGDLHTALSEIPKKDQGNFLNAIIPSTRGGQAFMSLFNNQGRNFNESEALTQRLGGSLGPGGSATGTGGDIAGVTSSMFDRMQNTLKAKLDTMLNDVKAWGIKVGGALIPEAESIVQHITPAFDALGGFLSTHSGLVKGAMELGTALLGVGVAAKSLEIVASLANPVTALAVGFGLAYANIKPFREEVNKLGGSALSGIEGIADQFKKIFDTLSGGASTSPLGDRISTMEQLSSQQVSGLQDWAQKIVEIARAVDQVLPKLQALGNEGFKSISEGIKAATPALQSFGTFMGQVVSAIGSHSADFQAMGTEIKTAFSGLGPSLSQLGTALGPLASLIGNAASALGLFGNNASGAHAKTQAWASLISEVVVGALQLMADSITAEIDILHAFVDALTGVITVVSDMVRTVGTLLSDAKTVWSDFVKTVVDLIHGNFSRLPGDVGGILHAVLTLFEDLDQGVMQTLSDMAQSVGKVLNDLTNGMAGKLGSLKDQGLAAIGSFATGTITTIGGWKDSLLGDVSGLASGFVAKIQSLASGGVSGIEGFVSSAKQDISTWVSDMTKFGGDAISNLASGITSEAGKLKTALVNAVTGAMSGAWKAIQDNPLFGFLASHLGAGGGAGTGAGWSGNPTTLGQSFGLPPGGFVNSGVEAGNVSMYASLGLPTTGSLQDWDYGTKPGGVPVRLPGGKNTQYIFENSTTVPGMGTFDAFGLLGPNGKIGQVGTNHMQGAPPFLPGQPLTGGTLIGQSGEPTNSFYGTGWHLCVVTDANGRAFLAMLNDGQIKDAQAAGQGVAQWMPQIKADASAAGIPANVFAALVQTESGGDQSQVSSAGAVGLTQLMPNTANSLGVNRYDPNQNLAGGARYLAQILNGPAHGNMRMALAMYNAGPNAKPGVLAQAETNYSDLVLSRAQAFGGGFGGGFGQGTIGLSPQGVRSIVSPSAGASQNPFSLVTQTFTGAMSDLRGAVQQLPSWARPYLASTLGDLQKTFNTDAGKVQAQYGTLQHAYNQTVGNNNGNLRRSIKQYTDTQAASLQHYLTDQSIRTAALTANAAATKAGTGTHVVSGMTSQTFAATPVTSAGFWPTILGKPDLSKPKEVMTETVNDVTGVITRTYKRLDDAGKAISSWTDKTPIAGIDPKTGKITEAGKKAGITATEHAKALAEYTRYHGQQVGQHVTNLQNANDTKNQKAAQSFADKVTALQTSFGQQVATILTTIHQDMQPATMWQNLNQGVTAALQTHTAAADLFAIEGKRTREGQSIASAGQDMRVQEQLADTMAAVNVRIARAAGDLASVFEQTSTITQGRLTKGTEAIAQTLLDGGKASQSQLSTTASAYDQQKRQQSALAQATIDVARQAGDLGQVFQLTAQRTQSDLTNATDAIAQTLLDHGKVSRQELATAVTDYEANKAQQTASADAALRIAQSAGDLASVFQLSGQKIQTALTNATDAIAQVLVSGGTPGSGMLNQAALSYRQNQAQQDASQQAQYLEMVRAGDFGAAFDAATQQLSTNAAKAVSAVSFALGHPSASSLTGNAENTNPGGPVMGNRATMAVTDDTSHALPSLGQQMQTAGNQIGNLIAKAVTLDLQKERNAAISSQAAYLVGQGAGDLSLINQGLSGMAGADEAAAFRSALSGDTAAFGQHMAALNAATLSQQRYDALNDRITAQAALARGDLSGFSQGMGSTQQLDTQAAIRSAMSGNGFGNIAELAQISTTLQQASVVQAGLDAQVAVSTGDFQTLDTALKTVGGYLQQELTSQFLRTGQVNQELVSQIVRVQQAQRDEVTITAALNTVIAATSGSFSDWKSSIDTMASDFQGRWEQTFSQTGNALNAWTGPMLAGAQAQNSFVHLTNEENVVIGALTGSASRLESGLSGLLTESTDKIKLFTDMIGRSIAAGQQETQSLVSLSAAALTAAANLGGIGDIVKATQDQVNQLYDTAGTQIARTGQISPDTMSAFGPATQQLQTAMADQVAGHLQVDRQLGNMTSYISDLNTEMPLLQIAWQQAIRQFGANSPQAQQALSAYQQTSNELSGLQNWLKMSADGQQLNAQELAQANTAFASFTGSGLDPAEAAINRLTGIIPATSTNLADLGTAATTTQTDMTQLGTEVSQLGLSMTAAVSAISGIPAEIAHLLGSLSVTSMSVSAGTVTVSGGVSGGGGGGSGIPVSGEVGGSPTGESGPGSVYQALYRFAAGNSALPIKSGTGGDDVTGASMLVKSALNNSNPLSGSMFGTPLFTPTVTSASAPPITPTGGDTTANATIPGVTNAAGATGSTATPSAYNPADGYQPGDMTTYNGVLYQANSPSVGVSPGADTGSWSIVPASQAAQIMAPPAGTLPTLPNLNLPSDTGPNNDYTGLTPNTSLSSPSVQQQVGTALGQAAGGPIGNQILSSIQPVFDRFGMGVQQLGVGPPVYTNAQIASVGQLNALAGRMQATNADALAQLQSIAQGLLQKDNAPDPLVHQPGSPQAGVGGRHSTLPPGALATGNWLADGTYMSDQTSDVMGQVWALQRQAAGPYIPAPGTYPQKPSGKYTILNGTAAPLDQYGRVLASAADVIPSVAAAGALRTGMSPLNYYQAYAQYGGIGADGQIYPVSTMPAAGMNAQSGLNAYNGGAAALNNLIGNAGYGVRGVAPGQYGAASAPADSSNYVDPRSPQAAANMAQFLAQNANGGGSSAISGVDQSMVDRVMAWITQTTGKITGGDLTGAYASINGGSAGASLTAALGTSLQSVAASQATTMQQAWTDLQGTVTSQTTVLHDIHGTLQSIDATNKQVALNTSQSQQMQATMDLENTVRTALRDLANATRINSGLSAQPYKSSNGWDQTVDGLDVAATMAG